MTPSEFREDLDKHKTRMNGLSCGEESMTIYSAVLIQYQRVADRQTDRQTDGHPDVQPISITCFSIAPRSYVMLRSIAEAHARKIHLID